MIGKITGIVFAILFFTVSGTNLCAASVSDGDRLAGEGKLFAAVEEYEEALKGDPGNAGLLVKLAEACDSLKWYGRAVQYWETLLEKDPGNSSAGKAKERAAFARRWIGVYFYETGGEPDQVLGQLDASLKHDPAYFDALYWKGRILFETGSFDEASKVLEKAVASVPKGNKLAAWLLEEAKGAASHGEAYTIFSGAYKHFENKEYDKALEMYARAAELNPGFARPLEYIARIYMAQEKYDMAAEYWDNVLAKEPDNKRAAWFRKVAGKELANQPE